MCVMQPRSSACYFAAVQKGSERHFARFPTHPWPVVGNEKCGGGLALLALLLTIDIQYSVVCSTLPPFFSNPTYTFFKELFHYLFACFLHNQIVGIFLVF